MSETFTPARLATIKNMAKMPEYKEAFTEASLRALVYSSSPRKSSLGNIKTNGLLEVGAIIRVGRKVLINLDAFDSWLKSLNDQENYSKQS